MWKPTARFFADILGFEILYRQPGYAYIEREGCGIRMMEAGEGNPLIPGTGGSGTTSMSAT
jgi:hypothetical protein